MERIEVTRSERKEVENARDAMHAAVINILKARGLGYMAADLSGVAELIALEGYFDATPEIALKAWRTSVRSPRGGAAK